MEGGVGTGSQCHVDGTATENHLARLMAITVVFYLAQTPFENFVLSL
jgi:hypothetical protein